VRLTRSSLSPSWPPRPAIASCGFGSRFYPQQAACGRPRVFVSGWGEHVGAQGATVANPAVMGTRLNHPPLPCTWRNRASMKNLASPWPTETPAPPPSARRPLSGLSVSTAMTPRCLAGMVAATSPAVGHARPRRSRPPSDRYARWSCVACASLRRRAPRRMRAGRSRRSTSTRGSRDRHSRRRRRSGW
jgi:hypothetical protein